MTGRGRDRMEITGSSLVHGQSQYWIKLALERVYI